MMIHEYEKTPKSIRNMEREDTEICQITLKLIFQCNPRSRSGFEVCPLAHLHVFDVPLITIFSDTYHLTEKFMKT